MTELLNKPQAPAETENLVDVIARQGVDFKESSGHYLGCIEAITEANDIVISVNNKHYEALAICGLSDADVGAQCLVLLQPSLPHPIILGVIQPANQQPNHLVLTAEESITLNCGDSLIELSEQGHINIQGNSINSQAYGPNRLKGASIKIN